MSISGRHWSIGLGACLGGATEDRDIRIRGREKERGKREREGREKERDGGESELRRDTAAPARERSRWRGGGYGGRRRAARSQRAARRRARIGRELRGGGWIDVGSSDDVLRETLRPRTASLARAVARIHGGSGKAPAARGSSGRGREEWRGGGRAVRASGASERSGSEERDSGGGAGESNEQR
ncbi:hypothetical protein Scep_018718 [Stephania cephalantha]|uniref:Uncharacterized protein n=1 Tax=Stephania cephalantha TaxID=152367 RepID=A0AAP0I9G0_9MAGN